MKCHAGIEFENGKPCPKCGAKVNEVCWPGINAELDAIPALVKALEDIAAIENKEFGPVWEEIDEAREIANTATTAYRSAKP